MQEIETWLPIEGYEGLYEVSNLGRVKNMAKRKGTHPGKILSPWLNNTGYYQVELRKDNKPKYPKVSRLVAFAFLPIPTELLINYHGRLEVNHKDMNRANDISTNLEWVTSRYNCQHAARNNPRFLTVQDITEIKQMLQQGVTHLAISIKFDVSRRHIGNISQGKRWSHVK